METTAENSGMTLCLAINYGGRTEIADAARRIAEDARAGRLDPEGVDEATFAGYLSTVGMPDPDLLIRTAGEMRLSNYLLWQVSYAELWVTPTLWPDFRGDHLLEACVAYSGRPQVRRPDRPGLKPDIPLLDRVRVLGTYPRILDHRPNHP